MQCYAYIVASIGKHIPASYSIKIATICEYMIVNPQNNETSERARVNILRLELIGNT